MSFEIKHGDCREVMATLAADSIDAIVSDPPYGLSFMGKGWDHGVPGVEFWTEALRVAKPGAHLLAFGGTRTYHRLACAIEDAGWDVRDCIMWVYGSGFPKSLDVSDAMEKWIAGERPAIAERLIDPTIYRVTAFLREARDKAGWTNKQIDELFGTNGMSGHWTSSTSQPAVPSFNRWKILQEKLGFGTELDELVQAIDSGEREYTEGDSTGRQTPFLETLKRNDFAESAGGWGTALKPAHEPIILARKPLAGTVAANVMAYGTGAINVDGCRIESGPDHAAKCACVVGLASNRNGNAYGEWAGARTDSFNARGRWPANFIHDGSEEVTQLLGDAARFFYVPKASREDRGEGNLHETVKPTDLMRYLCRLVTPPNGLVLDPFTGSGSTGKAALLEGFRFLGIEREAEYVEIARARCAAALQPKDLFNG